jgi:DNA-binding MarR family transcriptional regulator
MAVKRAHSTQQEKAAPVRQRTSEPRTHRPPTLPDFDPLIHERLRLGILSALAVNQTLSFNDLKQLLNTTDGNLSVHARKLEEAEYVRCDKSFDGRTPRTTYQLTAGGRKALEKYLDHMESLIKVTREK